MISRGELAQIDESVRDEVRSKADAYLQLLTTKTNVTALSEYVGPQMLGTLARYALDKYFAALAKGEINAEHGYDEDPLTKKVVAEIEKATETKKAVLVPSGTAANLSLITSFVDAYTQDGIPPSFIVWSEEHTVNTEGKMLSRTGLRDENIRKVPVRKHDGILEADDLQGTIEMMTRPFIVQMAIPTIMGVVPSMESVRKLADLIHSRKGKLLIDGARLTNALAHWGQGLDCLSKLGVDGFTLGSSKKGEVVETVCINDQKAADKLWDAAKSFGHISSKTSPLAYVTGLFFTTDWWKDEARSENDAATKFASLIGKSGINPVFRVDTNVVFVSMSKTEEEKLAKDARFGLVYNDYHPHGPQVDPNVGRVTFTGYLPEDVVNDRAQALIEAKQGS